MTEKILIMGLPGAGKTYFAQRLKQYLEVTGNRIDFINQNILKVVKIILVSWYVLFSLVVIFNLIYNNDCMSRIIYLEHTAISKSNNEILKKEYDYFLLDMRDNS